MTEGVWQASWAVRCWQAFLEEVMEEGWVLDGTIAQDCTQVNGIWGLREGISVALKHAGTPCFRLVALAATRSS